MNKAPMIILIPGIAIALVVVGAMMIKMFGTTSPQVVKTNVPVEYPNAVANSEVGKPTNFLGNLFGQATPTPTPQPVTAADLSNELKGTVDDGGVSDFNAIEQASAGL